MCVHKVWKSKHRYLDGKGGEMNTYIDTDGMIAFIKRLNKKRSGNYHRKKVYMYNLDNELVRVFETTEECADYFEKDVRYIYYNLKYCSKIRGKNKWYVLKREEIK